MKISVYGSAAGDLGEDIREKSREIGREIARRSHILLSGGCPGLPYEATLGAKEVGGRTIGFSPGVDLEDHIERFDFPTEGFDELIFIPQDFKYKSFKKSCLKLRNVSSVTESHAVILISGRCGTLNEFTIAYDLEKHIGVLLGTGGITKYIEILVSDFNKPSDSKIVYEEEPRILLDRLESYF